MCALQLIRCRPGDTHFERFTALPALIYPPPMAISRQAIPLTFFHQAYVVCENNKALARCVLYNNPYLVYQNKKAACFGNFEALNHPDAVKLLHDAVLTDALETGAELLIGPMNGSSWDDYRLPIESAPPPFFLEPHYPNYYPLLLQEAGLKPIARYVSNMDTSSHTAEERNKKALNLLQKSGITFRNIILENYSAELEQLHAFCMRAFKNNFLFTPISLSEFSDKYEKIKPWIDPQYVIIAENKNNDMLGFIFCVPNFSDKSRKGLIIKTLARDNSVRYGGLGQVLGNRLKKAALQNGYQYIIHALMIESNASKNLSNYFSGELLREYYLYSKSDQHEKGI